MRKVIPFCFQLPYKCLTLILWSHLTIYLSIGSNIVKTTPKEKCFTALVNISLAPIKEQGSQRKLVRFAVDIFLRKVTVNLRSLKFKIFKRMYISEFSFMHLYNLSVLLSFLIDGVMLCNCCDCIIDCVFLACRY